ncbi:MAG: TrkA family potassium uptake protein [Actinomycetota bacterium]|nr:TrkA family potassium uptake protein [Actinomycetota bacterium]
MLVIIAGCGRVGAQLAVALEAEGHEVVIIDKDPTAFRRLGDGFAGRTLRGVVFDRPTLEEAGIRRAQAFVAVTSGDNSNIVSSRTAKERFGVERVVCRIYDPERAAIYERLGIPTIASASWTAQAVLEILLPAGERVDTSIGPGEGDVVVVTATVPEGVHGVEAARLNRPGRSVLAAVTRGGMTRLPVANLLLESGDQVHVAVARDTVATVRDLVADLVEEMA